MNRDEFLKALKDELKGLPESEVTQSLEFYSEMIDDRMEDGATEEDAVLSLGNVESIAREILLNLPLKTLVNSKMKTEKSHKNKRVPLIIALAIPALIGAILYAVIWVVIASLIVTSVALVPAGVIGIIAAFTPFAAMPANLSLFVIGCGIAAIGAGIILSFIMIKIAKLYVKFSKVLLLRIKEWLIK